MTIDDELKRQLAERDFIRALERLLKEWRREALKVDAELKLHDWSWETEGEMIGHRDRCRRCTRELAAVLRKAKSQKGSNE